MTHYLAMVDTCAKRYDNLEVYHGKWIFSLTLVCDLNLGHKNLDLVHDTLSFYGGYFC